MGMEHVESLVDVQQEVAQLLVIEERLERLRGLDLLVAAIAADAGEADGVAIIVVRGPGRVGRGGQPGRQWRGRRLQGRRGPGLWGRGAVTLHLAGRRHEH